MKKFNWMLIPFAIAFLCVLIASANLFGDPSWTNLFWTLVWDVAFAFTLWKVVHPEDVLVIKLDDGKELERERDKLLDQLADDYRKTIDKRTKFPKPKD